MNVHASFKGTSLLAIAQSTGIVAAADDMLYRLESGRAVPCKEGVRKVFVSDNVIVGSAQLISYRHTGDPFSMEYELEDWISEFIQVKNGDPNKHPRRIAELIYDKMRDTFGPIDAMIKNGRWKHQLPGDRIVSYVILGYDQHFEKFNLFEVGAEVNANADGLRYLSPIRYPSQLPRDFRIGEDHFIEQAYAGIEPPASIFRGHFTRFAERVPSHLPDLPEPLQDAVASLWAAIKVESQFNPEKVGKRVNVVVIDRGARQSYAATF